MLCLWMNWKNSGGVEVFFQWCIDPDAIDLSVNSASHRGCNLVPVVLNMELHINKFWIEA